MYMILVRKADAVWQWFFVCRNDSYFTFVCKLMQVWAWHGLGLIALRGRLLWDGNGYQTNSKRLQIYETLDWGCISYSLDFANKKMLHTPLILVVGLSPLQ